MEQVVADDGQVRDAQQHLRWVRSGQAPDMAVRCAQLTSVCNGRSAAPAARNNRTFEAAVFPRRVASAGQLKPCPCADATVGHYRRAGVSRTGGKLWK